LALIWTCSPRKAKATPAREWDSPERQLRVFLRQVKSAGLAANSYLLGSGGVAAVIDPRRDCDIYAELARHEGARIAYIFETHRNEDFAVGSLELARLTGADVFHGSQLDFRYGNPLTDGQEFRLGSVHLQMIHTPGHTEEHFSIAVADLTGGRQPVMVFTGDALFVGDVGRLDLYLGGGRQREAAQVLYETIFKRLLPLGDEVICYPAHGGGSVCGGQIAERELSTLGIERRQNPALQATSREEFVEREAARTIPKPRYFAQMEILNLEGPPVTGTLPRPERLMPKEFARAMAKGAMVVDVRKPHSWAGGHIRGSYNIWLDGLAPYAGWVLPYGKPILLVVEDAAQIGRAVRYLYRMAYDRLEGYLAGGLVKWYHQSLPIEQSGVISIQRLRSGLEEGRYHVLDVREDSEWRQGHIKGAQHIFVGDLEERLEEVPRDKELAVHCSIGYRSGIAVSILERAGFTRLSNALGGSGAWEAAGYPVQREAP
jgi:hydroxyacylglutathione hydrolase